jgi:hypothetical protein
MFSGCLLLSYAHSMALTGRGSKAVLLQLKGQVIRCISSKMNASNGLLSPRCLTAILALGAPIVCLVSQDLPKGVSIWEYINVSTRDDYQCCSDSADIAQIAFDEGMVHQKAMCRLLIKSSTGFQDTNSLALLQYLSNYVDMYVSFKCSFLLTIF